MEWITGPVPAGLVQAEDVTDLVAVTEGAVLLPGDPGYAAGSCAGVSGAALVVAAASAGDVQNAVRFARRRSLPVVVKPATGRRSADGAVLITTDRMTGVRVDPGRRVVRVAGGTRWGHVVAETAKHGLAPLAGPVPEEGAVGGVLGGGFSPVLGRTHGYTADHVRQIDVVTADGTLRWATAGTERDLFWALRGGRGDLGVVTAAELDLFPVTRFHGGVLSYAGEYRAAVLHTWREWVQQLPEAATSSVLVRRLPPDPALPEPVRGAAVVHLRFAHLGPAAEAERLLAPLRAVAPVLLDRVGERPFAAFGDVHGGVAPLPCAGPDLALRAVTAGTVGALVELTGPDRRVAIEVRALGGALDREPAVPNAIAGRGVPFVVCAAGDPGEPWRAPCLPASERRARLAAVKKVYDPAEVFRSGGEF